MKPTAVIAGHNFPINDQGKHLFWQSLALILDGRVAFSIFQQELGVLALSTYPATKKEPLLEVAPVIADKILFAGDPGKIEAERPRLAPSAPGPSSAKEKYFS